MVSDQEEVNDMYRIMLVEDDATIVDILSRQLEKWVFFSPLYLFLSARLTPSFEDSTSYFYRQVSGFFFCLRNADE